MRLYLLSVVLIAFGLLLGACGGGGKAQPAATPTLPAPPAAYAGKTNPLGADAVEAGKQVFTTYCVSCHGEQGHGDGPAASSLDPKPKNIAELQKVAGDDYLFWRISEGVDGTAMVAWKTTLKEEEIWQVIAYLRTLK